MRRLTILLVSLLVASVVATTGATAALETRPADLAIEQPHYIDGDVSRSSANGTTVYEAEGEELLLGPKNFAPSDVVSSGVEESAGDLSLDKDLGVYRFSTTTDGSYNLYWTVETTRSTATPTTNTTANGTTGNATASTETVRIQYTATVRVDAGDRRHIPAGQLEAQREAAANWSEWEDSVKSEEVAGPDANMEEESQLAINLLKLRYNPGTALTGNFTQILLSLFITLGGLFVLLLFGGYHYVTRRSDIGFRHKRESLDAERADLEDQLLKADERDRLSALEGMDWNDIFPDNIARAFREAFGETVLDGYLQIQESLLPSNLIRDRLEAMSGEYVAVVEREDVATDGGAEAETRIVDAELRSADELDDQEDDTETVALEDPSEDLVEALSWDDPELRSFDLPDQELDQSEFSTTLEGATLEELVEEYDVEMRQFGDNREVFAEYLLEFLVSVHEHEFTDEEGRVRPIRYVFNLFLRTSRLLDEQHEMPLAAYQSEHIEYLLRNYDHDEEISEYVSEVSEGKYA
ncbi:hypothetical protein [Halosimplex pelagicum]|uniref:Uncharacterized protein n=1 Tax=Halosimplex pelagicum TaxID=869886 RepID=A0A7D5TCR9_9EURY|nr:hypothetical protein [Halosimplex pelagicum]QLH83393.1 hypothetical protein HZS54_17920 [Halosimplex pelagicum]